MLRQLITRVLAIIDAIVFKIFGQRYVRVANMANKVAEHVRQSLEPSLAIDHTSDDEPMKDICDRMDKTEEALTTLQMQVDSIQKQVEELKLDKPSDEVWTTGYIAQIYITKDLFQQLLHGFPGKHESNIPQIASPSPPASRDQSPASRPSPQQFSLRPSPTFIMPRKPEDKTPEVKDNKKTPEAKDNKGREKTRSMSVKFNGNGKQLEGQEQTNGKPDHSITNRIRRESRSNVRQSPGCTPFRKTDKLAVCQPQGSPSEVNSDIKLNNLGPDTSSDVTNLLEADTELIF